MATYDLSTQIFGVLMERYKGGVFDQLKPGREYKPITLLDSAYLMVFEKQAFAEWVLTAAYPSKCQGQGSYDPSVLSKVDTDKLGSTLEEIGTNYYSAFVTTMVAQGGLTPQNSRISGLPAVDRENLSSNGSSASLATRCQKRDNFECVISHIVDSKEAAKRTNPGFEARLEVAHIIPYSVAYDSGDTERRKLILSLLRMFGPAACDLIDGDSINQPSNAITLNHDLHVMFGRFQLYFEHKEGNKYHVDRWNKRRNFRDIPTTVTISRAADSIEDLPSQDLLGIHYKIGKILSMSAAGESAEALLGQLDEVYVDEGGSTDLGSLVSMAMTRRIRV